jgi:outer membrane lipoprotein-sorting protein
MITPTLFMLLAGAPTADALLAKAEAILSPDHFESDVTLTTVRAQGEQGIFTMHVLKSGNELQRVRFLSPTDDKGAEVLRNGDNMWNYLPGLRRAIRITSKQEFHGCDFSNGDVMRSNLAVDYTPKLVATTDDEYELELTAKNDQVAYERVRYWLRKKDAMPLRQELFTSSGKLVRKLEFQEPKLFGKHLRPSRLVMRNVVAPWRHSELVYDAFAVKPDLPDGLFVPAVLGR